ncbi:hypothetical protein [Cobetia sp. AM6]|uniref:hypothetical protein n=1 Tax=Cobetia sp. AM6 TaxID=2661553 RepID=UPI0012995074|nr:hypothetical protein [Cobetia sp. AM6]
MASEACSGNLLADNALGSQALGATNLTFYRLYVLSILRSINLVIYQSDVQQSASLADLTNPTQRKRREVTP